MILTESEVLRIFKDKNPIGETIIWRAREDFPFTVRAIVYFPGQGAYANIKMSANNTQQTIDEIEEIRGA